VTAARVLGLVGLAASAVAVVAGWLGEPAAGLVVCGMLMAAGNTYAVVKG
jgi:hypothetical protein